MKITWKEVRSIIIYMKGLLGKTAINKLKLYLERQYEVYSSTHFWIIIIMEIISLNTN